MNRSIQLLTIKGIDIRLHITFPLILFWAAFQFGLLFDSVSGALFGVAAISILFFIVTLHELGHSFAARMYGVPVKQIVLSPIGGVAQLARMPDKPKQELVIAAAGPAVNVLLAFVIVFFGFLFSYSVADLAVNFSAAENATFAALLSYVFVSNLFLAAFNLIPAFPMDGGRILRALLAMRLDYARATDIAAGIGRIVAVLFGIYGLFNGGIFMILIAFFIFTAAGQEAKYTRFKHAMDGLTVQQAYAPTAHRLSSYYTLEQAKNLAAYTGQQEFAVVDGDQLVGYLSAARLRSAVMANSPYTPVSAVMNDHVHTVTPETSLIVAQQHMQEDGRFAIPVVSPDGRYLGLVTLQQIATVVQQTKSPPIINSAHNA